ncbi:hypothetical protein [Sphingomonas sp. BK580]|uniref:hypothetical protein n=1 Tax=Sphingomonas sp. BK580 TaxID=2586972 RepID=UPI001609C956|nr:hypothetical protein [Sphingomonas sp. BK580]MBB3693534.1 hypothetical protein [Sphingomonas sp. BK580]
MMMDGSKRGVVRALAGVMVATFVAEAAWKQGGSRSNDVDLSSLPTAAARGGAWHWLAYVLPVLFAAIAAWRIGAPLLDLLRDVWPSLTLALSTSLAGVVVVARRAGRILAGLVAGLAIGPLVVISLISWTHLSSVDGCIGGQWKDGEHEASYAQESAVGRPRGRASPLSLENSKAEKKHAEANQDGHVRPVDCSALTSNPDRAIATVTMRLTFFAVIGTFIFGAVAVFALIMQSFPDRHRQRGARRVNVATDGADAVCGRRPCHGEDD